MINRRPPIKNPNESAFLGLFTGKKAKREAAAKVAIIEAQTEAELELERAKRESLALQLEAARQGFDPEADKRRQAIETAKAEAAPETTLYIIIGVVVAVVMAGLYFIKKR